MAQNNQLTHDEDPSKPGYTAEGAWAGQNSVLGAGGIDWEERNPWTNAPIHLAQLLAPALSQTGLSQSHGYDCATSWPGYTRPASPTTVSYSYPGAGATGVPFEEYTWESPFTPAVLHGMPQGARTGTHLYVYGPWNPGSPISGRVSTASLNGPRGPVALKWIDNSHPQAGTYLVRSSAILFPPAPLDPLTTYAASVTLELSGGAVGSVTRAWSFTTAAKAVEAPDSATGKRSPALRIRSVRRRGRRVTVRVSLRRAALGRLTVRGRGAGRRRLTVRRRSTKRGSSRKTVSFTLRLPRGRRAHRGYLRIGAHFKGRKGWGNAKRSKRIRLSAPRR